MQAKRIVSTLILMLMTAAASGLLSSCTASELPDTAMPESMRSAALTAADSTTAKALGEKLLTAATLVTADQVTLQETLNTEAEDAAYDRVPEEEHEPESSLADETSREEPDSAPSDEIPTEATAQETAKADAPAAGYKLSDIRHKLGSYSSVSFSIDSDSSFTLNYDSHKIPITVNADGTLLFLPETGEMMLTGQVTMSTSGQKKVIPVGFYILEEDGQYLRYSMQEDENWIREDVTDPETIYFHPDVLERYDDSEFGLLPDHPIADPSSDLYELMLESDFLIPLLSPINSDSLQTDLLAARMVLNTDQGIPFTISLDTDEYIGQMVIDSYRGETTAVTLEVLDGRTILSNFRYDEAERIKLPDEVNYTLNAATPLPEPESPNGDGSHNGSTWEPVGTEAASVTPEYEAEHVKMEFPEPITQATWDQLGMPILDRETGDSVLTDDEIASLLSDITIQVTERQSSGDTLLQPQVVNHTEYIVEHLSVVYQYKGGDLKLNTNVSALLPGQSADARILDGGQVPPALVRDGSLRENAVDTLVVYLIDREENIVMLNANRREDGTLAVSVNGGMLALMDSSISFDSLIPEASGVKDDKLGTLPVRITNETGITFKEYSLLYKNRAEGRWSQFKVHEALGPDQTFEGLQIEAGTAHSMRELQPLTLTLQVGSDTYNYDFLLGRLIRTNY